MELHILLAGVEFGPYTEDKARQLLGEGFLSASDPAKRLDETDWLPLSSVLGEVPEVPAAPARRIPPPDPEFAPLTFSEEEEETPTESAEEPAPEPVEPVEPVEAATAEASPEPEPASPEAEEPVAAGAPEPMEAAPVKLPTPSRPPVQATAQSIMAPTMSFIGSGAIIKPAASPATPSPVQAPPMLQVSVPSRGKKGANATRTGSLLAKEALQAARERSPLLAPARPAMATTTAPVPELEPEPAPPRRRNPVKLREAEDAPTPEPSSAPPAAAAPPTPAAPRKTIKLSGRVGMPGTAPRPELPAATPEPPAPKGLTSLPPRPATTRVPAPPMSGLLRGKTAAVAAPEKPRPTTPTTAPSPTGSKRISSAPTLPAAELAKFSGYIARPGGPPKNEPLPTPEPLTGPLQLRERKETGPVKPGARKTIRLSGPISLPGRGTVPTPPVPVPSQDDDDGPMVMARTSRPRITQPVTTEPVEAAARVVEPTPPAPEPLSATAPQEAEETHPSTPLVRGAEIAAAAAVAAETAVRSEVEIPEPGEALTPSGSLSSEFAEKRSLKITGALRPPPAAHPTPIQLSSPSSESGPLAPLGEARSSYVPPMLEPATADKRPSPPVPEEELSRPATGKINVSDMPSEGVKVRTTRRLTSKVPLPVEPTESLQHESPPRALPPPLPKKKIELPIAAAQPPLSSAPAPEIAAPASAPLGEPMTREEFAASPEAADIPAAAFQPAPIEEAPAPAPAPSTEAPTKPEKARLRRPVKLELTSRVKAQDSGRLPVEPFSKSKPEAEAAVVPAVVAAAGAVDALPAASEPPPVETPVAKTEEPKVAPIKFETSAAAPLSFPKKLEEAPYVERARRPGTNIPGSTLTWILYSIIGIGFVAACVVAYLLLHRSHTRSLENQAAMTAATEPAIPASAAPPVISTNTTPPPTNVAPPATNAATSSPSTNAAPANPPQTAATSTGGANPDIQHQAAAFVSDGILKYRNNDLDGAIDAFNQALDLNPKSADAYYNRGIAKEAHDDLDGAIADYSKAIQNDSGMAEAYYYRGLARQTKADLDGALADYNQAVQLNPKNSRAFFNRGLIRMQRDDIDGAILDSSKALELDPQLNQSYYDRGLGRLAKGAMDAALDDMKLFCQLAPLKDPYTDYARLYIWLIETRAGQLAEANQELSMAMNSGWNGASDSMVTRLGEYLLGQISEEELVKASASSIPTKDQGQRCEAWYFIGMRKLVAGDKDGAIEALRKCVATQKLDYCEYILAQEELKTLPGAADGGTPPPIRATPVSLPDPGTITPPPAGQ